MLSPEEVERKKEELAKKREEKKRRRRRRAILYTIYTLFAIVLISASAWITYILNYDRPEEMAPAPGQETVVTNRVNVLVLGIDEKAHDPGRTDTIMLASIDPKAGRIGVISVPRDTRVLLPGQDKYDRINAAHAYGGPELTTAALEDFLDIDIDYYVKVNFQGFEQLIDVLGGITIDVERAMDYDDNAQDLHIHLKPGRQLLNGEQALGYVRYRDDLGDVALIDPVNRVYGGRVKRQQKFIRALAKKVLTPATVIKIPALIRQLGRTVETDMPLTLAAKLGLALKDVAPDAVETGLIPGEPQTLHGASYWVPDLAGVERVVSELVRGQEVVSIEVLNGNGMRGIAGRAAEYFKDRGLDVIKVGNADHFNYRETQIIAHADRELAERVARFIGGQPKITAGYGVPSGAEVTVILGKDFRI